MNSHTNSIKYTCPRCGIHTCSLPCVKRHKSWAQCSGIRDPAAYRRRADLATPTSVDQDFNFITSVERSLQRANDSTSSKGFDLVPSGIQRDRKTRFDQEIEERGINLIKAPKGLSRNKQNKSFWGGDKKGLMWTTEWIHYDGRKKIAMLAESNTVEQACNIAFGARKSVNYRKRKRSNVESHSARLPGRDETIGEGNTEGKHDEKDVIKAQNSNANPDPDPFDPASAQNETASNKLSSVEHAPEQPQDTVKPPQTVYYYLFKPITTSKVKCVIPLAADTKVIDALRGRALLEFPTFYVREEAPEALPEPFMTEDKYNDQYGTDVVVNLPIFAPNEALEEGEVIDLQGIDEKRVLEVLQRDLNG